MTKCNRVQDIAHRMKAALVIAGIVSQIVGCERRRVCACSRRLFYQRPSVSS
jgi:hypothetical protein